MATVLEKLHFLIIVQGFFLSLLLFLRRPRTSAGRWLTLFVFMVSIETLQMYVIETGGGGHLIGLSQPLWFLIGPTVFLFAAALSGEQGRWPLPSALHFVPLLAAATYLAVSYYPLDAGEKQAALDAYIGGERVLERAVVNGAAALHLSGYAVLLGRYLFLYRRRIRDVLSNLDRLRLTSVGFLVTIAVLTALLQWFNLLYPYLGVTAAAAAPVIVNSVFMLGTVAVYGMGIYALARPSYLDVPALPPMSEVSGTEGTAPPISEAGEGEQLPSCKEAILAYMDTAKPYLDSDVTLNDLAAGLSLPSYRISKTINQELGCNFFQLVNRYRVEAVKQMLDDPAAEHQKLLAVAFDAGFNSKASFNAIFKKHTGMTPSEYRRSSRDRQQVRTPEKEV